MRRYILSILALFLISGAAVFNGCTKKSETELRREKDSLEQVKYDEVIRELIDSNLIRQRDSTDIY